MPFNHNHHYHRLLLRKVPQHARTALDVGCGHGLFARRLEQRGLDVDAIDPSDEVIEVAKQQSNGSKVRFRTADATTCELGQYDYVSCLASLHHTPFDTVTRLRDALNPGGTLAVLGLYDDLPSDRWIDVAAIPANVIAKLAVYTTDRVRGLPPEPPYPPVAVPDLTWEQLKKESSKLLPGRKLRRLVFWRYLMVYRKPIG
ncbi:class I SAM-dependent methyltransferase [Flindersiella endophytica]